MVDKPQYTATREGVGVMPELRQFASTLGLDRVAAGRYSMVLLLEQSSPMDGLAAIASMLCRRARV
jgi:hypothetical protein